MARELEHFTNTTSLSSNRALCSLCSSLRYGTDSHTVQRKLNNASRLALFHDECHRCSKWPGSTSPLCSFCNHLRLAHLVRHELAGIAGPNPPTKQRTILRLCLGTYGELQARSTHCEFCTFLLQRIPYYREVYQFQLEFVVAEKLFFVVEVGQLRMCGDIEQTLQVPTSIAQMPRYSSAIQALGGVEVFTVPKWIDLAKMKSWVPVARPQLNDVYDQSSYQVPRGFRALDVDMACLVKEPRDRRFAALSYVWGKSDGDLQATRGNISELEKKGSFHRFEVPATIKDAMTVTRKLGIRYLWVDRFCIVQDDALSKHEQINSMDKIYALSEVTLVDASGSSSRSGLAGVSRSISYRTGTWYSNRLKITFPKPVAYRLLTELLRNSPWSTRGWTHQEEVVSKNLLYFTHGGVFFKPKGTDNVIAESGLHLGQEGLERDTYSALVLEYTARQLGYQSDILRAFHGTLTWLSSRPVGYHSQRDHRFGFLLREFDDSIPWRVTGRPFKSRIPQAREVFPSWSWASVQGQVHSPLGHCGALASWAFSDRDVNGQPILTPVISWPESWCKNWARRDFWQIKIAMAVAWRLGCLDTFEPAPLTSDSLPVGYQSEINRKWSSYVDFWKASRGHGWEKRYFSNSDIYDAAAAPGRVLVHTQSTYLDMKYIGISWGWDHCFSIRKTEGGCIGFIELSDKTAQEVRALEEPNRRSRMEFLALSVTQDGHNHPFRDMKWEKYGPGYWEPYIPHEQRRSSGRDNALWKDMGYGNGTEVESDPEHRYGIQPKEMAMPSVALMLITRHGNIARRLGVGYVFLKRWGETKRMFKTIILE